LEPVVLHFLQALMERGCHKCYGAELLIHNNS